MNRISGFEKFIKEFNLQKSAAQDEPDIWEFCNSSSGFCGRFDFSIPYAAVAIHSGTSVPVEVRDCLVISEKNRRFEEDTDTEKFVKCFNNAVWALDSRAVYDLNRSVNNTVPLNPKQFWNTAVYKENVPGKIVEIITARYNAFYRFILPLSEIFIDKFGFFVIFDIHSYNITRQKELGFSSPPLFNLGTALLDKTRWGKFIQKWKETLQQIKITGFTNTVLENTVFQGKGEFCRRISAFDKRILVLPTEIAKVYMNECDGTVSDQTVNQLASGLFSAMKHTADTSIPEFSRSVL